MRLIERPSPHLHRHWLYACKVAGDGQSLHTQNDVSASSAFSLDRFIQDSGWECFANTVNGKAGYGCLGPALYQRVALDPQLSTLSLQGE